MPITSDNQCCFFAKQKSASFEYNKQVDLNPWIKLGLEFLAGATVAAIALTLVAGSVAATVAAAIYAPISLAVMTFVASGLIIFFTLALVADAMGKSSSSFYSYANDNADNDPSFKK